MHLVMGGGTNPRRYSARSFFRAWRQVLALAVNCRRERRWTTRNGIQHQLARLARETERKMCSASEQHELLRLRLTYCLTEPQQRILATAALAPAAGFTGEFLCWMGHLGQEESTEDPAADVVSALVEKRLLVVARGEIQARIWKIRYLPGPALEACVENARDSLRRRDAARDDQPRDPVADPDILFLEDFCQTAGDRQPPPDEVIFLDDSEG